MPTPRWDDDALRAQIEYLSTTYNLLGTTAVTTSSGGTVTWGQIIGNIENQTDLMELLDELEGKIESAVLGDFEGSIDLSKYALKTDLENLATKSEIPTVPTIISAFTNDTGYITEDALNGYAKTDDLTDYAKAADLADYAKISDLNTVAEAASTNTEAISTINENIKELQDVSETHVTKEELENYATKDEIPAVPTKLSQLENDTDYITATDIETKADKSDVDQLTETVETISSEIEEIKNAEADFVTEEELDKKGYLTSIPEEYVTEEILASKGYITETEVDTKLEEKANVSDLDNYVLKTDIPSVPTKVSELENDAEYITISDVEAKNYITEADIADLVNNETFESALAEKADKADVYTKEEVDAKVSSVLKYCGTVDTVADLPETAQVGDVYNVLDTGANYAYDGTDWDKLSETIDLSTYLTKEEAVDTYATIDVVEAKADSTDVYTKTEADDTFTTQLLTSSKGTAEIFNESDGGGSRFKNTEEGITSYVGTNDGSFDGLYAQIYARPDDTKIGTRINIYTDMACYCTTADSAYGVKSSEYELAVKGDLANFVKQDDLAGLKDYIEALEARVAELEEKLNN